MMARKKGSKTVGENMPKEAVSVEEPGVGSLDSGPIIGPEGQYLPATYRTRSGIIRTDN